MMVFIVRDYEYFLSLILRSQWLCIPELSECSSKKNSIIERVFDLGRLDP